jgi:AcrR family transcriptional regulator
VAAEGTHEAHQREAIIAAARRLLDEEGPRALTTRRIAEACGLSTMAIYSRFGSKEGVVEALYTNGFAELTAALGRVRRTASPANDVARLTEAYRAFALDRPSVYSVMFERVIAEFRPGPQSAALAQEAFLVLEHRVADLVGCRPGSPHASRAAYSLWALVHGLVMLELRGMGHGQSPDGPAVRFRHAVRHLVAGLTVA